MNQVTKTSKVKSNSTITHEWLHDGRIKFAVRGAGERVFDPRLASTECKHFAQMPGFTQRVSDGGALSRNPDTGLPATPQDKWAKMNRIMDHYESGATIWEMRAAARVQDDAALGVAAMIVVAAIRAVGGEVSSDVSGLLGIVLGGGASAVPGAMAAAVSAS
jgi:hypothetical protein